MPLKFSVGLLVSLILLFGGRDALCQNFSPEDYRVEYFGIKQGLSSRIAHNSIRDTVGVIWSGTSGGLCRIDDYGITRFTQLLPTFQGPVRRDENGWLYVNNWDFADSVEVINPATLEVWGARFNDRSRGLFGGIIQRNGQPLYFAQGSIVYAYTAGRALRQVHLLSKEVQLGDKLIAASEEGYIMYRKSTRVLEEIKYGKETITTLPTDEPLGYVHLDKNGYLWVSNSEGTFRRPPDGDFISFLPPLPDEGIINFFAEDDHGNMFFGFLDPVLMRVIRLEQIIDGVRRQAKWVTDIENRILTISGTDFRKSIRLNTYGGIYALDFSEQVKSPFKRYLYRDLLPGKFGDVMRGFAADDEGYVYANKDSKMPYWFRVDPKSNTLDTITMLKNDGSVVDHLGCGTNLFNYHGDIFGHSCDLAPDETYLGYVYRYRPANGCWKRWPLPEPNHVVRWVTNGRTDDELLLITEEKKYQTDGHLYYFYPARDSFAFIQTAGPETATKGYTKSVVRDDNRNCLWIGTDQAFYRFNFDSQTLHSYTFPDGRPTFVADILLRKNGRIVLATIQAGLQEFDPDTGIFIKIGGFIPEGQQPPDTNEFLELPTDDIATLNLTKDDELLLTTFKGLVFRGTSSGETSTFTTRDGLGSDEFNTASIFFSAADQRWYAGGINGFVSFSTDDLKISPSPYNPVMLRYRILDRGKGFETLHPLPSVPTEALVLEPSVIYCTLDFTIPDYFARGERRYQTKLEGLDLDWSSSTTSNSVRYTSLAPGTYTFRVRAYDGEGRKGQLERCLTIIVLKPFYQRWWFILLGVLLVLAILYGMHRFRMTHLREKMERERKVLSLELRSLRQQLNPHFISNAMNAIKEYIQRPNTEDSARYLTDFSLMMRSFLESSRRRFTPIADEVDMMKRYVSLEQLRYPGKFDVVFTIDPDLDPAMDEVPSLLLQPIIENAIEHGLRPLNSGGYLRICFELDPDDDDVIICTVSDNGVGRKIAAMRSKSPGHISRATAILEERQALLASDDEIKLSVLVTDLYPEREHTGTVVTVRIEAG
ncbi:MAG: hypothetical protein ACJAWN_002753 [Neolewinella sp.]|jgi:hypothetical protein